MMLRCGIIAPVSSTSSQEIDSARSRSGLFFACVVRDALQHIRRLDLRIRQFHGVGHAHGFRMVQRHFSPGRQELRLALGFLARSKDCNCNHCLCNRVGRPCHTQAIPRQAPPCIPPLFSHPPLPGGETDRAAHAGMVALAPVFSYGDAWDVGAFAGAWAMRYRHAETGPCAALPRQQCRARHRRPRRFGDGRERPMVCRDGLDSLGRRRRAASAVRR